MTQRTQDQVRRQIAELALAMAPAPGGATGIDDPDLVDDLGYHSLALLELAFALEDEFELPPIDQERAQRIRRVGDVADYVVEQLRIGTAAGGVQ
ncbi:phosphopantetheine-binding protein [Kutzneria sp. NPDC052558]|uniref:phosphopantetheine-binding protein n=1 Tax=Kutzneria sp. NPDC052558 TaxID=3364121 RepID=UPI0037CC0AC6